jgi:hypothetical protein
MTWWKRALVVVAATLAATAGLSSGPHPVRSAEPPMPEGQAPAAKQFHYFGSFTCSNAGCHGSAPDYTKEQNKIYKDFIHFDEYPRWMEQDKHRLAFDNLKEERGRKMESLLKKDVTDRATGCLGCHSASPDELSNRQQGDQFKPQEGVSCENCHGAYEGWDTAHRQVSFRELDAAKRLEKGNIDVRVPEIQANQCLSCHIGSEADGKVVTHEMYAAGHPPLPSIEVATFTEFIPRHWKLAAEKDPKYYSVLHYQKGQLEQTKLAMVGAAVALRTSMRLLADETTSSKPIPGLGFPDFARYDCWSCHHDLKRDSWRQQRGYDYVPAPGRVPVAEWPVAIVELGIEFLNKPDLQAKLEDYRKAIRDQADTRPFGQKTKLASTADEFAKWADKELVQALAGASYERPTALKLLKILVAKAQKSTPDYDSARLVGWMIELLVKEAGPDLAKRDKIQPVIDRLDKGLRLRLPKGRDLVIEKKLGEALTIIGDYEPKDFQRDLKELGELLDLPASN